MDTLWKQQWCCCEYFGVLLLESTRNRLVTTPNAVRSCSYVCTTLQPASNAAEMGENSGRQAERLVFPPLLALLSLQQGTRSA